MCWEKIAKVSKCGYIDAGKVKRFTHYFYIPKGNTDIRIVYDVTSLGLNECLFALHFSLPTVADNL